MHETLDSLPLYLRKYVAPQRTDDYTPRDQAAWRYIMRQSRAFFKDHAVGIYLDGLRRTGITVERIPSIDEIDAKLKDLGWGAVPVSGFIPPAAFLDFQARRILPIASDMRSPEHIAYTPAPDIVHEAAGHAPVLADHEYSEYLTHYAAMAQRAIFCQEDLDLYEAIRTLSDCKENPDSTKAQIAAAELGLTQATAAIPFDSEATKVARMNWWTVEYGLLGDLKNPKIYGAGLLSSVGESQACLGPNVTKQRLTLDCIHTSYNITEPQPQLFVAEDLKHLTDVLVQLEATLAFRRGGIYGLSEAKRGRTVNTVSLDSGIEISGKLSDYLLSADGQRVEFIRFAGPCQLAAAGEELPGQGISAHASGFSTPLGRHVKQPDKPLAHLGDGDLSRLGIQRGAKGTLTLTTGFQIVGDVVEIFRLNGKLALIKWRNCTVSRGQERFFQPDWGDFDQAVGEDVVQVYGGPADRERYGLHEVGDANTSPRRLSPFSPTELHTHEAYADLRRRRERGATADEALALATTLTKDYRDEWLLRLEAQELAAGAGVAASALEPLKTALELDADRSGGDVPWLVRQGLALAGAGASPKPV